MKTEKPLPPYVYPEFILAATHFLLLLIGAGDGDGDGDGLISFCSLTGSDSSFGSTFGRITFAGGAGTGSETISSLDGSHILGSDTSAFTDKREANYVHMFNCE